MFSDFLSGILLQSPYALLGLLALAIPLIIHLLSKSKAKLILFANIALITQTAPKRINELRLTDIILLLLRLLLIILSVIILAQISFTQSKSSAPVVHVVTQDWLEQQDVNSRLSFINTMQDQSIYLLTNDNSQIQEITENEFSHWQQRSVLNSINDNIPVAANGADEASVRDENTSTKKTVNIMLALARFSEKLADETLLHVYTTDRANQFDFVSRTLKNKVKWHISSLLSDNVPEKISSIVRVVVIFDDNRASDLAYLQRVMTLLKLQNIPNLTVDYFSSTKPQTYLTQSPDWIFYLSDKTPSNALLQQVVSGSHLFVDAKTSHSSDQSITLAGRQQVRLINRAQRLSADINIFHTIEPLTALAEMPPKYQMLPPQGVWLIENAFLASNANITGSRHSTKDKTDILTKTTFSSLELSEHAGEMYQFYSQLSPRYNDLILQRQFPLFIQALLFSALETKLLQPYYRLSGQQIAELNMLNTQAGLEQGAVAKQSKNSLPFISQQQRQAIANNQVQGLSSILIIALLLLWSLERLLSEFSAQRLVNTNNELDESAN
jgi:hypothetical protein